MPVTRRNYFAYKIGQTIHETKLNDIIYLESNKRKLTMHLANGNTVVFYGKLKDVYQQQLYNLGFIHIHASYVVNYNYISKAKYNEVVLVDGTTLPISQLRRKGTRKAYLLEA